MPPLYPDNEIQFLQIVATATAAISRRHLDHYERLGRDETARQLRALFDA